MHTKQMLSDAKDALEKKNGYATLDKEKPQPALKTKETSEFSVRGEREQGKQGKAILGDSSNFT